MKGIGGIYLALFVALWASSAIAQDKVVVEGNTKTVVIQNGKINLRFNLENGLYTLGSSGRENVIEQAFFRMGGVQSKDECEKRSWTMENFTDELGKGKALIIRQEFANYANILWKVYLYDDYSFYIFQMGTENDTAVPYQLMSFYPLMSYHVYQGKDFLKNYRILDGNTGGSPTKVTDTANLTSFNNIMVRFGETDKPNILVAGGVSYHEFEKFAQVIKEKKALTLSIYAADPVGKRIDAGKTYWPEEKFYLNFENDNPFDALEQYASVLKKMQHIKLNYYDFPTECLWYASYYNTDSIRPKFNNSSGAVEEMENAIKSGITKYTKIAIRLVPDAYGANNQQGWWDDEHWGKYNEPMSTQLPHYTAPYLTTDSWAKAVSKKGGYPFTYMQSGRRSEDFVKLHPDWMLFNDPYRPYYGNQTQRLLQESSYNNIFGTGYTKLWWAEKQLWGYDFTDPGFIAHMKKVYANLKRAGIKGVFYDYPEVTAWAYEGGFEDKYATTAWAYRNMFQLAKDGLDDGALLQERNIARGSDIALGTIASQRVWGDTDGITPEMLSFCGLRWYKNRTVINYDMDSKDPSDALPKDHNDGNRSMLTMTYVTSGRFLLGRSFSQLTKAQLNDLSRTFPYHTTAQSARPVDAFDQGTTIPRIYDFAVHPQWHQLTFYNFNMTADREKNTIGVYLGKSLNEGGIALNPARRYYIYDFWNDHFIGLIDGNTKFEQELRPGETRMMSVHTKENNPQFISTNRHVMQGYVDLKDCKWNAGGKSLDGRSEVIEGDTYEVIIAMNGWKIGTCTALDDADCTIKVFDEKNGLARLAIHVKKNRSVRWKVRFKQQ